MTINIRDRIRISEEAALWVQRLENEDSPELRGSFDEWLRQGTAHAEELLRAQEIWRALDQLDHGFRLGTAPRHAETVITLEPEAKQGISAVPAVHRKRTKWVAIAAALLLACGGAVYWSYQLLSISSYVTAVGSQESVQLSDGSVMHLNTRSKVQVRYTERVRQIRLLEGEALFTVARDAARPFIVAVEDVSIEALGTQFNVYRSDAHTTRVAVIDGAVQVASGGGSLHTLRMSRLKAGEELEIAGNRIVRPQKADVERSVAWRQRRLMFDQTPIDDIAREFNRYNRIPIRIEGEALRSRRMGGTFDADDPLPLIRYLSKDPRVEVIRNEQEILIRAKDMQKSSGHRVPIGG